MFRLLLCQINQITNASNLSLLDHLGPDISRDFSESSFQLLWYVICELILMRKLLLTVPYPNLIFRLRGYQPLAELMISLELEDSDHAVIGHWRNRCYRYITKIPTMRLLAAGGIDVIARTCSENSTRRWMIHLIFER